MKQLAEMTLELLGQKKSIMQVPNGVLKGLTAVATTLHIPLPYNPHVVPYATKYWFMDSSKAQRELGWRLQVDVEEGIRRTIDWARANPWYLKGPTG